MSTRSIIIITGNGKYNGPETTRLYKHSDGYPTDVLNLIQRAMAKSQGQCVDDAARFKEREIKPVNVDQLVGNIIGESTSIYGQGARVEAEFPEEFTAKHLGNQGDLEWIYIIQLETKTLGIFGGGYTGKTPQTALKNGPVNPEKYALNLYPEYQAGTIEETRKLVQSIQGLGFSVNANQPKPKPKPRGKREKIKTKTA